VREVVTEEVIELCYAQVEGGGHGGGVMRTFNEVVRITRVDSSLVTGTYFNFGQRRSHEGPSV